jgi:hypothetical protein
VDQFWIVFTTLPADWYIQFIPIYYETDAP